MGRPTAPLAPAQWFISAEAWRDGWQTGCVAGYDAGVAAERERLIGTDPGVDLVTDARARGAMAERQRIVAAIREYAETIAAGIPPHLSYKITDNVRDAFSFVAASVADVVEKLDTTGEGS